MAAIIVRLGLFFAFQLQVNGSRLGLNGVADFENVQEDVKNPESTEKSTEVPAPTKATDVERHGAAEQMANEYKELTPKLADQGCQDAVKGLQGEMKEHDGSKSSHSPGAKIDKIRNQVMSWFDHGDGQKCKPFLEGMHEKVGGGKEVEAESGGPGVMVEVGLTGTVLVGTAEASMGVLVLGKRRGTVVVKAGIGLKASLAAAAVKIGFLALRDTTDMNEKECVLEGELQVPGFPMELAGIGFGVLFHAPPHAPKPTGIVMSGTLGPSIEMGLPVGANLVCLKVKEIHESNQKGKGDRH